jgi:hypothetical protein
MSSSYPGGNFGGNQLLAWNPGSGQAGGVTLPRRSHAHAPHTDVCVMCVCVCVERAPFMGRCAGTQVRAGPGLPPPLSVDFSLSLSLNRVHRIRVMDGLPASLEVQGIDPCTCRMRSDRSTI